MKYFYFILFLCLNCYSQSYAEELKPVPLSLSSPAFSHEEAIPSEYTCDGQGISPSLSIHGVSKRAQSLMLVAVDKESSNPPDEAVIWFMYNISPQTKTIGANQIPPLSIIGRNSDGTQGYQTPCPKDGLHHYYFVLYAISTMLPETVTSQQEASSLIKDHVVGYASLMGTYERK